MIHKIEDTTKQTEASVNSNPLTQPVISDVNPSPPPSNQKLAKQNSAEVPAPTPIKAVENPIQANTAVKKVEPSIPTAGGSATVKGIFYQTTRNSSVSSLMIDIDNINAYTLTQRKANAYELVLENAKLAGRHLTLPQFPPDTFKGFEVVLANQDGNNVIVKVYVEDDVTLSPFIAEDQLWLKVNQ